MNEKEVVRIFKERGLDVYRIPLSGGAKGFKGDVEIRFANKSGKVKVMHFEVKSRKSLPTLYKETPPYWLYLYDDKSEVGRKIFVVSLEFFADILSFDDVGKSYNILLDFMERDDLSVVKKKTPAYLVKWLQQARREKAFLIVKANYKDFLVLIPVV